MNSTTFLRHHGLASNPFSAEEARQDEVFARIEGEFHHPDFAKICGDLARPSTAVVFGERGSGKTAIRLQMLRALDSHNAGERGRRGNLIMGIAYDDFDPFLAAAGRARHSGGSAAAKAVMDLTLADHLDALLSLAVPAVVDGVLGAPGSASATTLDLGPEPQRVARGLERRHREHLLLLQALYDRNDELPGRARRLRRALRLGSGDRTRPLYAGGVALGILALALLILTLLEPPATRVWAWNLAVGVLGIAAVALAGWGAWLSLQRCRAAARLTKALRVLGRNAADCREVLAGLPRGLAERSPLPRESEEEPRFALLGSLMEVLRAFGHTGMIVVVDRVDEPVAIAGDPTRMRALVWPLLNSKLLQFPGLGVKLLLPAELRPMLAREAGEFFRGARLDKQNLIERLVWPGATLYDLCVARMAACRSHGGEAPQDLGTGPDDGAGTGAGTGAARSLVDLFDESVRTQDLVDALDQLQQPRDAFKFLYQCIQEHCGGVPEEAPSWRIPRALLDVVRKREVQRMQDVLKGARAG